MDILRFLTTVIVGVLGAPEYKAQGRKMAKFLEKSIRKARQKVRRGSEQGERTHGRGARGRGPDGLPYVTGIAEMYVNRVS